MIVLHVIEIKFHILKYLLIIYAPCSHLKKCLVTLILGKRFFKVLFLIDKLNVPCTILGVVMYEMSGWWKIRGQAQTKCQSGQDKY